MHALLLALARECAFTMAIYSPHKEVLRKNINFYILPSPHPDPSLSLASPSIDFSSFPPIDILFHHPLICKFPTGVQEASA